MLKRCALLGGVVVVALMLVPSVEAAPKCSASESWEAPAEGAVAMFRKGDRVFAVGADSGGAVAQRETAPLWPGPDCDPVHHSKCAQNIETCSGSCTAYLNYWCKTCDCKGFRFCD